MIERVLELLKESRSEIVGGLVVAVVLAAAGLIGAWILNLESWAFTTVILFVIWLICIYVSFWRAQSPVIGGGRVWKYPRLRPWSIRFVIVVPSLMLFFFLATWGIRLYQQVRLSHPEPTPTLSPPTPAPGKDISSGCISVAHWIPFAEKRDSTLVPGELITAVPQTRCWYLYDWGIFAQDNGLLFKADDVESGLYGISTPLSHNSKITLTLEVNYLDNGDKFLIGVVPSGLEPSEEGVFWEISYWEKRWESLYRLTGEKQDAFAIDTSSSHQELAREFRFEITDARLTVHMDGLTLNREPINVVYSELWFWIGYEVSILGGNTELQVTNLSIDTQCDELAGLAESLSSPHLQVKE